MVKPLEQALKDRAFFYVDPQNNLTYLDDGYILTPSIGGGAICKAYWVKDSPQHVTLLSEVCDTREKFISFMRSKIKAGVDKQSVINLAISFGAISDETELATPIIKELEANQ